MGYLQHETPCDPSRLTRWCSRIGEEGCGLLLAQSVRAAGRAGVPKRNHLATVTIDTTVKDKPSRTAPTASCEPSAPIPVLVPGVI
jgi:hypothetical protein